MTYSSKTTCPDRVLPSTSGFFFSERRSKVFTLHTPHFTLHSSHSKLQTSRSTLHTSHSTLHTSQSALHTSHFSLLPSHSKPHTALFTPHTSHCSEPTWNQKNTNATKWRKSADKSLWQPSCSHSNTIYEVELQKTIVLRMQPQHEATLTQPLQCDLQRLSCKTQKNYAQRRRKL